MSNCTCGRTTRPPFCDHSHALTDEQYKERTERLIKLKQKIAPKNWVHAVTESLPEHSSYIGQQLLDIFDKLPSSIDPIDAHACALVAAICSNNGELAFEIGMNGPLISTEQREQAKAAAVEIYQYTIMSNAIDSISIVGNNIEDELRCYKGTQLYLFAGAVVLRDRAHIQDLSIQLSHSTQDLITIAIISSLVASIGKIAI